ncbi:MAG: hypothetical protein V4558_13715 [Gemmatimonadota bacterium]
MNLGVPSRLVALVAVLLIAGCRNGPSAQPAASVDASTLVGAWRSTIAFRTGPLAGMKNLEFLYAYNAGGTMTESSNYDEAANSSPPAYGVWKAVKPRTFETKYLFFTTATPDSGDAAVKGGDWWPAGHGVLTETITLSEDAQSYTSTIKLTIFDKAGKPIAGDGDGIGTGVRIVF